MDTKVLSTGVRYSSLPESYVRPESDRPRLSEVSSCEDVPLIDLGPEDRTQIVKQIGDACKSYGFFQVINHGVSSEADEKMLEVAHELFSLSLEEKFKLYSDDPSKTMRLPTHFNVKKEKVHNWRDYLRLHCHPLEKYVPERAPSTPSAFNSCRYLKRNMAKYFRFLLYLMLLFHSLALSEARPLNPDKYSRPMLSDAKAVQVTMNRQLNDEPNRASPGGPDPS